MFVDRVKIFVKGGDGGRGCVSFRREPYVPRGGPDGGVGRPGWGRLPGSGLPPEHAAAPPLPHRVPRRARRARRPGQPHGRGGRRAGDPGAARARSPPTLRDGGADRRGAAPRASACRVAKGGRGGRGNRSFLSNRNRAPRESEPGETGEERWLQLDLQAAGRRGPAGVPQRRQVDAAGRALGRAPEDRGLPVHDALARAGRGRGGRPQLRDGRHPRASSRARTRARAWACSSCATCSARACWCTWWTPRAPRAAIPWRTSTRCARKRACGTRRLLDKPQLLAATKRDAAQDAGPAAGAAARGGRAGSARLPGLRRHRRGPDRAAAGRCGRTWRPPSSRRPCRTAAREARHLRRHVRSHPPGPPARRRERAGGGWGSTRSRSCPRSARPTRAMPASSALRPLRDGGAGHGRRTDAFVPFGPRARARGAELHGRHRARAARGAARGPSCS